MRKTIIAIAGLAAAGFAAVMLVPGAAPAQQATLYKNPSCGCCTSYAAHLRRNGFDVTVKETDDLVAINDELGIPGNLQSCHVMFVDGYAVSGHVPIEPVRQLLAERPALRGITLPGMPAGSPGMGGAKAAPFTIYGFGDGARGVYAVE